MLQRVLVGAGVVAWLGICAAALLHALDDPGKFGIAVCAALIAAPILLRSIHRLPVYLLAAYAALVPFNDVLNIQGGATITRLLGVVAGGCLVLSIIAMGRTVKPSRAVLILLIFMPYLGATIFWAIDPTQALAAYTAFLSYAWLFGVISLYPFSPGDAKVVLGAMLVGALAQAGYGDYSFWSGHDISGTRLYIGYAAEHGLDPNSFAAGLLTPIAIVLMMFLRSRFGFAKLLWLAALLVVFIGFLLSSSRGAAIALGVMFVFLAWRSRYRVPLFAIGVVSAVVMMATSIGQRFTQSDVNSADGRTDIWKVGVAALHQYWLTGAGIGNFNGAFSQYYLTVPHMWLAWDRVAHSIFLQSAVEYGVFGFTLLMIFWCLQFRDLADAQATGVALDVCTALRAGVLGLFVAGISLDLMESKSTWLVFSLIAIMRSMLAGAGVAVDKPKRQRHPKGSPIREAIAFTRASPDVAR